ncbi:MAG TPA: PemK family transcriptional regulator [Ruminococcaceae bacterium]|nr:PemK family transcriptional regulator [Oscillospiraceae bacterium]HCC01099.1 PemK family transcriptional regulator [Oscillospiraceae bacterium]HCM22735.1 PemK family transcriptional regulator [Oscillospiraceae bacterium]
MQVKRGDIFYADLSPVIGSEQGGVRPVLIVQNDVGNRFSPTVIAAAITSQRGKTELPTHIHLNAADTGLSRDSIVLLEQVRTLDKHRLREYMGRLDDGDMTKVDRALSVSFGLIEQPNSHSHRRTIANMPSAVAQVSHGAAT